MTSKEEQADLGRLILQTGLDVLYIKDVHISENVNEHGRMTVRFLTKAGTKQTDAIRQQGMEVRLVTVDKESVFCGICTGVKLFGENDYMEAELMAVTASILTDQDPQTHTFQGTGKTLGSVFAQGIGKKALTAFEPGAADLVVSEMLSQENETDWAFDRRIANQYGKQLFVDSKATGCQIHIGNMPFREKEPGIILSESVKRSVDKVRSLQGNNSPSVSVFEYENTVLVVSNLTVGVGYTVKWQGRMQTVVKSTISCRQGLVRNEITLANAEGLSPSAEQFFATENISSILTGKVLDIDGNNVMVDFGSAGDEPRWIPYAHAVSNYFYCMPDVDDTVFVYYETGDSDKILCLGSRHVNDSPDFGRYQDKMLTADNRMIKFGEKSLELVGNRAQYDGIGEDQAQILFNDEFGIEIWSTGEIHIEATDGGKVSIQSVGQDFEGMDALKDAFEQMYQSGNDKYVADGGADMGFDALGLIRSRNLEGLKQSIKGYLMAPFQLVGTLQELAGRIGGERTLEQQGLEEPEPYTDGVVDIYGLDCLVLRVGNSSITFANGIIQIKADSYMELGTDRSITYEHLEDANYTWKDMFLDVAQLALDIVGALPIPGVSTAANLINAGVSLARGDYVGAAMSAGTALVSLIPGANSAIAAGKAVATAAVKGSKVMKTVAAVAKVVRAVKTGAQTLNTVLTTGMAVWDVGTAVIDGSFDWNDPKCRQDVFTLIQAGGSAAQSYIKKNTVTDENGTRFKNKDDRKREREQRREARRAAINNAKEGVRAKLDEYSANRCKNGEPIDMVTGSYLIEQCDFIINDISGIYAVERTYESLLSDEDSPVGRGWTLSLFSVAYIYDDKVEIVLPDSHTETFLKTEDGYRNRRGGTKRMELQAQEDGYLLKEAVSGISRLYDARGKLLRETDRSGNSRQYHYMGNTLRRISFASGQYLDFVWEGTHVQSIRDCIGRTVSYSYENNLLVAVRMVTGGVEKYAYDPNGRVTDITDAGGTTYVHNEYDQKGRVTRQLLYDGQEYIMLYDDDDRINTYLTPKSGREVRYTYDRSRQIVCTGYQDGTTQERRYDAWENIVWEKDRNGNVTQYTYDPYGHLLEEVRADGLKVSYEYDGAGNCLHMYDSGGTDVRYAYDARGNLIEEIEQLDDFQTRSVHLEYDSHGRVTAFTDANGHKESYQYDSGFWQADTFRTAGGTIYQHRMDEAGRCMGVRTADGETTYGYTNFDLVSQEEDPLGNTTRYIYDLMADLVGYVRPNGYDPGGYYSAAERYTNDAFHRRLSRTDCTGAVYAVHRDGEGNITKEISPNAYDSRTNDGAGIEYIYDDYDRAVRVYYPDGGILRRWYDPAGNLVKTCSPTQYDPASDSGAGYTYEYDSMGRLIQAAAPDGTVLRRYVYDLHGNLTKLIRADWMRTGETDEARTGELYAYNRLGWLMEARIPVSVQDDGEVLYRLTKYRYDKAGNRIQERRFCESQTRESESGIVHTIDYTYDADDRLVRVGDCTGAVLEYQYDGNNRLIHEKRRISGTTEQAFRYTYDAAGRMIALNRTADREGCGKSSVSVKYAYDKNGNNIKTLLPTGAQILREYDAADRLISERHVDKSGGIDNTTKFTYDKAGNLAAITDNQGRSTQIEYDLMNREIKRTERDGSVTRQFYDPDGQLVKVIRPNEYAGAGEDGKGVQYTYDAQGRVLTVIRADGTIQESNTYDAEGNLIHTQDGTGNGADMEYDLGGRRTKISTRGKASQQYEYDALGNITGITDGAGNHTAYILDKWGRIVEIQQADGSSEYYGYDCAGNITSATDGEGNTTTYEYNGINQLSVMTDPTGEQEIYHYDAQERLCRKTDRNGTETTYAYNIYDNLTERRAVKTDGTGLTDRYEYTPEGLLQSAISQGMRYNYAYDALGRLTEKRASGRTLLSFQYDLNGNLTHQTDVTGKVTEYRYDLTDNIREVWDNGKKIAEYEYNADGTKKHVKNGSLYTEYAYDADRNLTGLKTLLGAETIVDNRYTYDGNGDRLEKYQKHGTTRYGYDSMRRLAKVEYPNATEELFYDKASNRTRRLYNGAEELYQYDKRNRLTAHTKGGVTSQYEYDNAGNLLKDDRARYEYDAFNHNTKVETFNGNIQINRYDAEGLRHEMEENGRLVSFIFRGDEVVAEESQEDRIRYIRTSVLLASDAESARTYYHYASDEMSSITHVVDSENEEILNRYEYDAWGNFTTCEEKVHNRFKFNGQQYDPVSQQYYLRARYYNPVIGRFTQEDSYNVDGLNLYAYCRNNPVYYVDPSGNICETAANRIMDKFTPDGMCGASRNEQKKLAAYLRNKERKGGNLSYTERRILNQIDDYTYLSRYDNQTMPSHLTNESSNNSKIIPPSQVNGGRFDVEVPPARFIGDSPVPGSHNATAKVIDRDGNIVKVWREASGNATDSEKMLGTGRMRQATHTEQRTLTRINLTDETLLITGQQNPCTNCQGSMRKATANNSATIIYQWREHGQIYQMGWKGDRKIFDTYTKNKRT